MADLASLGTIFNPDYQGIENIRLNYGPCKAIHCATYEEAATNSEPGGSRRSQTLPSCLRGDHVGSGGDQMRDDGKLDSELNERLIKSIEGSAKTVIFGRLVDKN